MSHKILIFTQEEDFSSNEIMLYLLKYKQDVTRVNRRKTQVTVSNYSMSHHEKDSLKIKVKDKQIEIDDSVSIWFRRGVFSNYLSSVGQKLKDIEPINRDTQLQEYLKRNLIDEKNTLNSHINNMLGKKSLGNPHLMGLNKLDVLMKAREFGILVPPTYIVSTKEQLIEVLKKEKKLITKAIHEGVYYSSENTSYYSYTQLITQKDIPNLPENYFPSLFQKAIEKELELRVFFLDGDFYSMAILSQKDKQTEVDFREYNESKPNRMLPYRLSEKMKEKLTLLFQFLKLNTGSVDLIKDRNGDYIFLEINPVGQFGMVSKPCNYNLEKKVAKWLMKSK